MVIAYPTSHKFLGLNIQYPVNSNALYSCNYAKTYGDIISRRAQPFPSLRKQPTFGDATTGFPAK